MDLPMEIMASAASFFLLEKLTKYVQLGWMLDVLRSNASPSLNIPSLFNALGKLNVPV